MIGCLLIAQDAWTQLYTNCSTLFSPPASCVLNSFTGSDCQRPNPNSNDLLLSSTQNNDMYTINSFAGTGLLDNAGPGWATKFYTGQDADRRRRSLLQVEDNEGGGGGSGQAAGCWPDFYDVHDFSQWIAGSYQEPYYGGNRINPVGVIFWILQALGIMSMAFV
ncbi:hypothetical protein WJX73_006208 [Symbiochloris irregularis]|uniref:Uncharacterized protein n=1 Tax=Symbiochloris irregularis TaxID=706552 RepID=A0AAW1NV57_9CHLO